LKRLNGINNSGLKNYIFDVDFDQMMEGSQLAKPQLDDAFKILCQKYLISLVESPELKIGKNHVFELIRALTVTELNISDEKYDLFRESTFKFNNSATNNQNSKLLANPLSINSVSLGFGIVEEDIKHNNMIFGFRNEKVVILAKITGEESVK
jgi:hypothetical protein